MLMAWAGHPWGPWFLVFPLIWIAIVVLLVVAFRSGWGRRPDSGSPENILGERFARGEITESEYRERLGVLRRR